MRARGWEWHYTLVLWALTQDGGNPRSSPPALSEGGRPPPLSLPLLSGPHAKMAKRVPCCVNCKHIYGLQCNLRQALRHSQNTRHSSTSWNSVGPPQPPWPCMYGAYKVTPHARGTPLWRAQHSIPGVCEAMAVEAEVWALQNDIPIQYGTKPCLVLSQYWMGDNPCKKRTVPFKTGWITCLV